MKLMQSRPMAVRALLPLGLALMGCASYQQQAQQDALKEMEAKTGLKPVEVPGTEKHYLGKVHRGYPVLYTAEAGDVWGRWAARVAVGEAAREAGGVLAYLAHSQEYGTGMAGSPLDRLLSAILGQPLSLVMILQHGRAAAPRLDVLSDWSPVKPDDPLPRRDKVGWGAGYIYSADPGFAAKIAANPALMDRLSELRNQYIRVDRYAVTLFWAGNEKDYSAMINDHGGWVEMINAFLEDLADIAAAIPPELRGERQGRFSFNHLQFICCY